MKVPKPTSNFSFLDKGVFALPFLFTFAILFLFNQPGVNPDTRSWSTFLLVNIVVSIGLVIFDDLQKIIPNVFIKFFGFLLLINLLWATNLDLFHPLQNVNCTLFGITVLVGTICLFQSKETLFLQQPSFKLDNKILIGIILLLTFILALYLRYDNFMLLDSNRDEEHHMMGARSLIENGYFQYERCGLVTVLTAIWAKILGAGSFHDYLKAGRMSMPIIGGLTIFPIYYIGKFINKRTGLIAAFLFALSPWAIGMNRFIREHTPYLFVVCIFILLVVHLFKRLLQPQPKISSLIWPTLGILFILFYAFSFDWLSTLKITGVIFVCLNASLVIVYFSRIKEIILRYKYLIAPMVAVLALTVFFLSRIKFLDSFQFRDARWSNTFLMTSVESPKQWWTMRLGYKYIAIFFLFSGMVVSILRKQKMYFVYLICFFLMLFGYQYFLTRYFAPKYVFYLLPLYIVCIAYGVDGIIQALAASFQVPKSKGIYALFCCAFLLIFNPVKIYNQVKTPPMKGSQNMLTGLIHLDKKVASKFLDSIPKDEFENLAFISSVYDNLIYMNYDWECVYHYKYKSSDKNDFVKTQSERYPKGYMILDSYRNGLWKSGYSDKLQVPFKIGESNFRLLKNERNCMIYEWGENVRSPDELYEKIDPDNRIETNTIANLSLPLSLSFWIYEESEHLDEDHLNILSIGENSSVGFVINYSSKQVNKGVVIDYGTLEEVGKVETPIVRDGNWHHLVVYQSGGVKGSLFGYYLDGVRGTTSRIPIHKNGNHRLFLNNRFSGDIQDVEVYQKMLSPQEVLKIYNDSK